MNKIAILSNTSNILKISKDIKSALNADIDYIILSKPNSHQIKFENNSTYSKLKTEDMLKLSNIMLAGHNKNKREIEYRQPYNMCIYVTAEHLHRLSTINLEPAEHTAYGLTTCNYHHCYSVSTDFFYADSVTFSMLCDAYRTLSVDASFLNDGTPDQVGNYFYNYMKMIGCKFKRC